MRQNSNCISNRTSLKIFMQNLIVPKYNLQYVEPTDRKIRTFKRFQFRENTNLKFSLNLNKNI